MGRRKDQPAGEQSSQDSSAPTIAASYGRQDYEEDVRQQVADETATASASNASGSSAQLPSSEEAPVLCSLKGLYSGLSGGALGYVFGYVPRLATYKAPAGANLFKGRFGASNLAGVASGKSFAIFGGVFAAATCWSLRLRQKEDVWNSTIGGGATGLVMGWQGGPSSALQSALGFAAFSYIIERMGMGPSSSDQAAHASQLGLQVGVRKESVRRGRRWRLRLSQCSKAANCLVPSLLLISIPHENGADSRQCDSLSESLSQGASKKSEPSTCEASRTVDRSHAADSDHSIQLAHLGSKFQAAFTPAAEMLRPVVQVLAPCSTINGGCLRRKPIRPSQ